MFVYLCKAQVALDFDSDEFIDSMAVFTDITWSATDSLRLFGGLRYSEDDKEQFQTVEQVDPETRLGNVDCENLHTKLKYDAVTGRAGLQYDVFEDSMIFAQFSRGFKAGGFAIGACGDTFEPEELDSIEIGLKSRFFDGRLQVNASVYDYDYTNLQVEQIVFPSVEINNAQAEVQGAEMDISYIPFDSLSLFMDVSYMDAAYTEFSNADTTDSDAEALGLAPAENEDVSGNKLSRSPRWSGSAAAQYNLNLKSWGNIDFRAEAVYKQEYYLREFNLETDKVDEHVIYNAYANYYSPGGKFALRGSVKNIEDTPVISGLVGIVGFKAATYNPPRLWSISLEYKL